jgi:hypothetical protein
MWRNSLYSASGFVFVLFGASGADAASLGVPKPSSDTGALVQRVHSVYEAEETLHRRGYYDVRVERTSLPYSFNACKRGVRYHIHVDYYGDLVQLDALGPCDRDDYPPDYDRRRYYDRSYSDRPSYDRPSYDRPSYDRPSYDRPSYDRYRYRERY